MKDPSDRDERRFKLLTLQEILDMPPRTDEEEAEYRRGYCDGFVQAIDSMAHHMKSRRAARKHFWEVYNLFWDFWRDTLATWRREDISNHWYFPPRPRR